MTLEKNAISDMQMFRFGMTYEVPLRTDRFQN